MEPDVIQDKSFKREISVRAVLLIILVCAFIFGYLDMFLPCNFERLHVFLFNLTVGGFIIIRYTEDGQRPSLMSFAYLFLSICYSFLTYFELYGYAAALSVILAGIVETFRIRRFSFFPADFFSEDTPAALLFHHAALLCLSLALLFSSIVILNDRFLHIFIIEKLTLDVFFLGYSFPVSLITMSVMFSFIKSRIKSLEYLLFWIINPGVVLFFIFILFRLHVPEIFTASLLAVSVAVLFIYFLRRGCVTQQKQFLMSGMIFLLGTAVTGVGYAALPEGSTPYRLFGKHLLMLHSYLSLYGWNLSGILVIMRWKDFPIHLNSRLTITLHWLIILIMAPLGRVAPVTALMSICVYIIFLGIYFLGKSGGITQVLSGGIQRK